MNKNKKYVLQRCMAGILSLTGLVACFTCCNKNEEKESNQTEIIQTTADEVKTTKEETTRIEEQKNLLMMKSIKSLNKIL